MKDIVSTGKRMRRELFWFLGCLAAAELFNAFAILKFDRPWSELLSMIGFVIVLALELYAMAAVIRVALSLVLCTFRRKSYLCRPEMKKNN